MSTLDGHKDWQTQFSYCIDAAHALRHGKSVSSPELSRAEQSRAEQSRAEQSRAEQSRAKQSHKQSGVKEHVLRREDTRRDCSEEINNSCGRSLFLVVRHVLRGVLRAERDKLDGRSVKSVGLRRYGTTGCVEKLVNRPKKTPDPYIWGGGGGS